ncbi:MAG: ISL3 family transposase [Proteobacteria bacterium]|nr:ISL3 family transposase [Pseudomonadota bacterium]
MELISSLFEKALNLESPWTVKKIDFDMDKGVLTIAIDFPRGSIFPCPKCGTPSKAYDSTEKQWRHLNFFQYACYLTARTPRIECKQDGILQVEAPWARPGADFTLLFESFAMMLCREMPVNCVSRIIGADDNKLWRMMHYYTEAARQKEDYSGVTQLGVDETSRASGHDYVSLFVDLEKKRTIFVAEGKGSETMTAFVQDFKEHHGNPDSITDVSIDMSPAFIKGAEDNLPNAAVTFDKYHIMKIINKAVDAVRMVETKQQDLLRGQKYLFLKNRENLTQTQLKMLKTIESMPRLNLKTVRAYHIRENFQDIYKEETREGFGRALKKWYFWATHSRISPIRDAARTIKRHWSGVLRWYVSRINNGILEGLNSLVQAAKAKARGYKTFKNLKTIIYMITGKLDYSKTGLPT